MLKDKLSTSLIAGSMVVVGLGAGIATMASAQSATPTAPTAVTSATTTQTVDTPEVGDVADSATSTTHAHAPLGGDGVVSSITGTTIVMAEESDEGAASYTIDASKATVTNNGAAATLADVKVGQKIFVQGTTTGTNVVATSVSLGHPGEHMNSANDPTDSTTGTETAEPAGSTDASDQ